MNDPDWYYDDEDDWRDDGVILPKKETHLFTLICCRIICFFLGHDWHVDYLLGETTCRYCDKDLH